MTTSSALLALCTIWGGPIRFSPPPLSRDTPADLPPPALPRLDRCERSLGMAIAERRRSGVGTVRLEAPGAELPPPPVRPGRWARGRLPAEAGVRRLVPGVMDCSARADACSDASWRMSYSTSAASCLSRDRMSCRCALWSRSSSRRKRKTSRRSGDRNFSRCLLSSITMGTIASTVALRATSESTLPLAAAAAEVALGAASSASSACTAPPEILASRHASSRSESASTASAEASAIWPSSTAASTSWHNLAVTCNRCSSLMLASRPRRIWSRLCWRSGPLSSNAAFSSAGSGAECCGCSRQPLSWKRSGKKELKARRGARGSSMSKRHDLATARRLGSESTSATQKARSRLGRHLM
mmetsp:Transcript_30108/g.97121  ORF Transcript_30108/g.97121 Transcript_30108/m.97121 type:complete len:357 (+) Transcript_30108:421-1491(+)